MARCYLDEQQSSLTSRSKEVIDNEDVESAKKVKRAEIVRRLGRERGRVVLTNCVCEVANGSSILMKSQRLVQTCDFYDSHKVEEVAYILSVVDKTLWCAGAYPFLFFDFFLEGGIISNGVVWLDYEHQSWRLDALVNMFQ